MDTDVLKYFLPSELLEHFTITGLEEKYDEEYKRWELHISIEEKKEVPQGYEASKYEPKDFQSGKPIQDFPIRGKAVYLHIKRRRWRNKANPSEIISNDYSFLSGGNKLTKELSDFLKGTGRNPDRYH